MKVRDVLNREQILAFKVYFAIKGGDDNEPIHPARYAQQFFITFCYNKAKWRDYGRFKVLIGARSFCFRTRFGLCTIYSNIKTKKE